MLLPYAFILWIPTVASLLLYMGLWNVNELLGRSPVVYGVWFLAALAMQYFSPTVWFWLAGLLLQTGLAILLSLKWYLTA